MCTTIVSDRSSARVVWCCVKRGCSLLVAVILNGLVHFRLSFHESRPSSSRESHFTFFEILENLHDVLEYLDGRLGILRCDNRETSYPLSLLTFNNLS